MSIGDHCRNMDGLPLLVESHVLGIIDFKKFATLIAIMQDLGVLDRVVDLG